MPFLFAASLALVSSIAAHADCLSDCAREFSVDQCRVLCGGGVRPVFVNSSGGHAGLCYALPNCEGTSTQVSNEALCPDTTHSFRDVSGRCEND